MAMLRGHWIEQCQLNKDENQFCEMSGHGETLGPYSRECGTPEQSWEAVGSSTFGVCSPEEVATAGEAAQDSMESMMKATDVLFDMLQESYDPVMQNKVQVALSSRDAFAESVQELINASFQ